MKLMRCMRRFSLSASHRATQQVSLFVIQSYWVSLRTQCESNIYQKFPSSKSFSSSYCGINVIRISSPYYSQISLPH